MNIGDSFECPEELLGAGSVPRGWRRDYAGIAGAKGARPDGDVMRRMLLGGPQPIQ
jgi:hypothetical protein